MISDTKIPERDLVSSKSFPLSWILLGECTKNPNIQHCKENITCPCWVLVLSLLWFVNRRLIFRERGNKIWNEISILQRLAEQIDVISLMFLFEYKGGQFKRNYSRMSGSWVMGTPSCLHIDGLGTRLGKWASYPVTGSAFEGGSGTNWLAERARCKYWIWRCLTQV